MSQNITTETTEETGADVGVLASLGLNGQLFTFQLINFAVVAVIIWFLILKPLTKKSKKVQENLTKAERDYQKKIDDAKSAAGKILDSANLESKKLSEQLKIQ